MSLLKKAKKYMMKNFSKNDPRFSYSIDRQLEFLNRFKEPENNIERSYYQYLCQKEVTGNRKFLLFNLAAAILLPFYLIKICLSRKNVSKESVNAVAFLNDIQHGIIPISLRNEAKQIKYLNTEEYYYFDKLDRKFLLRLWKKYPFSFYFIFKIMMKISMYSYAINCYAPQMIIAYVEYSFTSSILTDYCRIRNVEHVNVLHGEKPLFIRDAFVAFDRFYVWDEFYINQFKTLHAKPGQFRVEVPPAFLFSNNTIAKKYDFIYYLGNEEKDTILNIYSALNQLTEKGYSVAIRPHPRYSNIQEVRSICCNIHIEDTSKISIQDSLCSTYHAIALFSTALNQGYYNGVEIVIDDISDKVRFEKLKSLNYIGFIYKHTLLSGWL